MHSNRRINPFRFPPSVIGLEVSHDNVCAVALRFKRKKWTVLKTVKKGIPPSSDASTRARQITEVLNELDVKVKQVVTSFSSSDMIVKIVNLPTLQSPEELPQLMAYELEHQLPIPLSEAACDYHIIPTPEWEDEQFQHLDNTTVLLAAVRRNRLNDHLALMENTGVFPKAVIPSFLMFLNALFASPLLSPHEAGFIGAVNLSASVVDVVVVEHGVLSFARSFANRAETPYDLLRELQNTLRDFLQPTGKNQLEKLLIVTEDSALPFHLSMENLTEALAFPHCEHKVMENRFALGLVAGHLNMPHALSLNLLKPLLNEQRAKEKRARKERALRFGPLVAMLVLVVAAVFLLNQTNAAQKKLAEAKTAQQLFKKKVNEKEDLAKLSGKFSRQIEALCWIDAGYPSLSYRLYQVAMSIPQKVWLKEVSTPPQPKRKKREIPVMDTLIVTGHAFSQADIDDFMQQLRELSCFSEIRQDNTEERTMNKQKVLLFQLSLHSEPVNINE